MNLGLVMMVASRSSRLRARFCATVPSPSASIGVHNLRNWISASIGASPPASRAFCSSSSPIGASSGPKSGAFSSSSPFGFSSAQSKVVKKRMMFKQLSNLSETQGTTAVEETLELFRKEDETSFTKSDLVRWAKLLYKKGKLQHAVQVFDWMQRKNLPFSQSETAIYVDLLVKTKGLRAAHYYYWRMPYKQRSDKAFSIIMKDNGKEIAFEDMIRSQYENAKLQRDTPKQPIPPLPPLHDANRNLILDKAVQAYMDKIGFPLEIPGTLSKRAARKFLKSLEELPVFAM